MGGGNKEMRNFILFISCDHPYPYNLQGVLEDSCKNKIINSRQKISLP